MLYRTIIRNGTDFEGADKNAFKSLMKAIKIGKSVFTKRYTTIILFLDDQELYRSHGLSPKSAIRVFRDKLSEMRRKDQRG